MTVSSYDIRVTLSYEDNNAFRQIKLDKGYINSLNIHQSISERIGNFSITLSPKLLDGTFYDSIKNNSLIDIHINNKLRFQGIVSRPTTTGQISQNGRVKRDIILRGEDFGYLLRDVNKTLSSFDNKYIVEEANSRSKLGTIFNKKRFIADQIPETYKTIINSITAMNGGQEYTFADGETQTKKFGATGNKLFLIAKNNVFLVNAPIAIKYLEPEKAILDFILSIADPVFSEVYGDCYDIGDSVGLGPTASKIITGQQGYKLVIRPKPYNGDKTYPYFDKNVSYKIDKAFYQYSSMKDSTKIYNYFVVGNSGFSESANKAEAVGKVARLNTLMRKYGYKPFRHDLRSVWGSDVGKGGPTISNLQQTLANVLKEWYADSDNYVSGQLSFPYNEEARIGRNVIFSLPKEPNKEYHAYTESVDTVYDAEQNRLHNVITYTRGRVKYSAR